MNDVLKRAIAETNKYIDMANAKYGLRMICPAVSFNLRGRVAGRANYNQHLVKFNKDLMIANEAEFFARTIPHEVAHLVAWQKFGLTRVIKPHGAEWQRVMRDFGVKDITRCHSYDTSNVRARVVRDGFMYKCDCMEHNCSSILHRRMLMGRTYRCRLCKGRLVLKSSINEFERVA